LKRDDAKNCGRTYSNVTDEHDELPLAGYSPTTGNEVKSTLHRASRAAF